MRTPIRTKLQRSLYNSCQKNSITLLTKYSGSIRILQQLVSYFSLADKSTLKVDETLSLYENIRPWWLGSVPGWVKKAMSSKQEKHQFVIGYLNQDFEPSMAIFEVNDTGKASGIFLELAKATGLRTGEYRDINKAIDPRMKRSLFQDANRQAKRVMGLCTSRMFDDAEPVLEKLDTFVYNDPMRSQFFEALKQQAANLSKSQLTRETTARKNSNANSLKSMPPVARGSRLFAERKRSAALPQLQLAHAQLKLHASKREALSTCWPPTKPTV